ncbi:hypothetical protein AC578_10035 [Pseudocercospora eumusae]|uniref:Uncharacterized protein n=1 Tax=Pseudocercospora eumusae TaxID=321146 RepID=A0A139H6P4_9PEZI|nr:hypothetical protein AC578_10035 [Pseudocercospora eumusae]
MAVVTRRMAAAAAAAASSSGSPELSSPPPSSSSSSEPSPLPPSSPVGSESSNDESDVWITAPSTPTRPPPPADGDGDGDEDADEEGSAVGSGPKWSWCGVASMMVLVAALLVVAFLARRWAEVPRVEVEVGPPCHVRGNPNLHAITPCFYAQFITRLGIDLRRDATPVLDALAAVNSSFRFTLDRNDPLWDAFRHSGLGSRTIDHFFGHVLPDLDRWELARHIEYRVQHTPYAFDLPARVVRYAHRHQAAPQSNATQPEGGMLYEYVTRARQRLHDWLDQHRHREIDACTAATLTLELWRDRVVDPLRTPSTLLHHPRLPGLLDPAFAELYRIVDHLAVLVDDSPRSATLERALAPMLMQLRKAEAKLLLSHLAVTLYAQRMRAHYTFAQRLEAITLAEARSVLGLHPSPVHPPRPDSFSNLIADLSHSSICPSDTNTPPDNNAQLDAHSRVSLLLRLVESRWRPRLQTLEDTILPQVARWTARRWAMDHFMACDEHDVVWQNHYHHHHPTHMSSSWRVMNSDPSHLGCPSHPSPFLRRWFASDAWMPQQVRDGSGHDFLPLHLESLLLAPGLLDPRRRPWKSSMHTVYGQKSVKRRAKNNGIHLFGIMNRSSDLWWVSIRTILMRGVPFGVTMYDRSRPAPLYHGQTSAPFLGSHDLFVLRAPRFLGPTAICTSSQPCHRPPHILDFLQSKQPVAFMLLHQSLGHRVSPAANMRPATAN